VGVHLTVFSPTKETIRNESGTSKSHMLHFDSTVHFVVENTILGVKELVLGVSKGMDMTFPVVSVVKFLWFRRSFITVFVICSDFVSVLYVHVVLRFV
jgi:hypothetical protein